MPGQASFQLGQWRVDPAACELCDGDTVVRLRPKVMDLLAAFARNPGEVLSKHCLLDLVWSDVTVGDASLTVAVGELRDALGDDLEQPEFIETIPRRGYRLIAPVTSLDADRVRPGGSRFWLTGAGIELVLAPGREPHRPRSRGAHPHRVAEGVAPPREDHRRRRQRSGRGPGEQERDLCRRLPDRGTDPAHPRRPDPPRSTGGNPANRGGRSRIHHHRAVTGDRDRLIRKASARIRLLSILCISFRQSTCHGPILKVSSATKRGARTIGLQSHRVSLPGRPGAVHRGPQ